MIQLSGRGLRCERDDRSLFCNLDISVSSRDVIQLVGPNGAGKTTLLRLLAGLNTDFDGELFWEGEPLQKNFARYAQNRVYLGHLAATKPALTALENLRWLTALWNPSEETLLAALDEVSLGGYEHTLCMHMSAGQQRRVALAKLSASPAALWILDEPFTALDVSGVAWLEKKIAVHAEENGAVIITSHHGLTHVQNLTRINLEDYVDQANAEEDANTGDWI